MIDKISKKTLKKITVITPENKTTLLSQVPSTQLELRFGGSLPDLTEKFWYLLFLFNRITISKASTKSAQAQARNPWRLLWWNDFTRFWHKFNRFILHVVSTAIAEVTLPEARFKARLKNRRVLRRFREKGGRRVFWRKKNKTSYSMPITDDWSARARTRFIAASQNREILWKRWFSPKCFCKEENSESFELWS